MKRAFLAAAIQIAMPLGADQPARWYNVEIVHNTVHELQEVTDTFSGRLSKQNDSAELIASARALQAAVDHLHDEMENDPEAPAAVILKAFSLIDAPFSRFRKAVRANQLRHQQERLHLYEALEVGEVYGRLQFWMTSVP